MKNQTLSIEQMKHLKELGVDTSKASIVLLFLDENGECVGWGINHGKEYPLYEVYDENSETWMPCYMEILDAKTGNYDHSFRDECGVFTLQDIISMLPKMIPNQGSYYDLSSDMKNYICYKIDCDEEEDEALFEPYLITKTGDCILDIAYQILCWVAENGYLKNKEE